MAAPTAGTMIANHAHEPDTEPSVGSGRTPFAVRRRVAAFGSHPSNGRAAIASISADISGYTIVTALRFPRS